MGIKYSSFIAVERDFWKRCSLIKVQEVLYGESWFEELPNGLNYIRCPAVNPVVYVDYEFFKKKYGENATDEYVKTVMDIIKQSERVVYISYRGDSNEPGLYTSFPIVYAKAIGKEVESRCDYEFGINLRRN